MAEPLLPTQQCFMCKHYHGTVVKRPDGKGEAYSCDAFEEGIPDDFILTNHDHTKAYPGDNGIRWEPAGEEAGPSWQPW
jgi:hypothetical protein